MASTTLLFGPPPPAPGDTASLEFMEMDLWRSKLLAEDLAAYPIATTKFGAPAYVIPYTGNPNGLYRIRINRAENKYLATKGVQPDLWIPPGTDLMEMYDGDLWIVEGEKKAAAVYKHWQLKNVVGIGGCWNAVIKQAQSEAYSLIPNLQHLCVAGRTVHLILDSDVIENKQVGKAASTLHGVVSAMNCELILYRPPRFLFPGGEDDDETTKPQRFERWKGVDDWIANDPESSPQGLEQVKFQDISINRTALYEQLGLHLNDKQGLILNEVNGAKLLAHFFKGIGILNDKRLGFVDSNKQQVSPDRLHSKALHYLQGDINPRYPMSAINGALGEYQASDNQCDLVRDFFKQALKWDGVPRLETWGSQYFECGFEKLANEWGRILFTGLVFRVLNPGCKMDTVCILNGPQGIGKTTFFEELAAIDGFSFYRTVMDLPGSTGDDRTFKQSITKALIIDLGEGIIFESRKTSTDRLKQFLTERFDEYRVAYAKSNTISLRGYIFVGTTNRGDQLSDMSGSRRFLYLNVSKIKKLEYETKLQIIAEVVARQEEIDADSWWDLRLTMEDMPQTLREEHSHIKSVSELLNVEHYRPDAMAETIQQIVESGELATFNNQPLLSVHLVAQFMGNMNVFQSANAIARKLTELSKSPQFAYTFEKKYLRLPQIKFKSVQQESIYKGPTVNSQLQVSVYIVKRK